MPVMIKVNRDMKLTAGEYLLVGPGSSLRVVSLEALPQDLNTRPEETGPVSSQPSNNIIVDSWKDTCTPAVSPTTQDNQAKDNPASLSGETRESRPRATRVLWHTLEEDAALDSLICDSILSGDFRPILIAHKLGINVDRVPGGDYSWLTVRLRDGFHNHPLVERRNVGKGALRALWHYFPRRDTTMSESSK